MELSTKSWLRKKSRRGRIDLPRCCFRDRSSSPLSALTPSLTTRCNNQQFIISSTAIQFGMRSLHIQFHLYSKRLRPMLSSVSTICPHQNTTSSIPLDLVLLQKLKNQLPNLHRVRLPHKVACIQQMNFRLGQIPFERLSAWWNENRIILSPNRQ
jgi:hypothetical protein